MIFTLVNEMWKALVGWFPCDVVSAAVFSVGHCNQWSRAGCSGEREKESYWQRPCLNLFEFTSAQGRAHSMENKVYLGRKKHGKVDGHIIYLCYMWKLWVSRVSCPWRVGGHAVTQNSSMSYLTRAVCPPSALAQWLSSDSLKFLQTKMHVRPWCKNKRQWYTQKARLSGGSPWRK